MVTRGLDGTNCVGALTLIPAIPSVVGIPTFAHRLRHVNIKNGQKKTRHIGGVSHYCNADWRESQAEYVEPSAVVHPSQYGSAVTGSLPGLPSATIGGSGSPLISRIRRAMSATSSAIKGMLGYFPIALLFGSDYALQPNP